MHIYKKTIENQKKIPSQDEIPVKTILQKTSKESMRSFKALLFLFELSNQGLSPCAYSTVPPPETSKSYYANYSINFQTFTRVYLKYSSNFHNFAINSASVYSILVYKKQ